MRYNEFLYMDKIVYNNFIPMYIYEKQHIIIYTYRSVSADVFPIQLGKKNLRHGGNPEVLVLDRR